MNQRRSRQRRTFLHQSIVGAAALAAGEWDSPLRAQAPARDKLPVAGICTVYRKNSHADVILGKILEGYDQKGGAGPDLRLASLYLDQTPANEIGRELARKHGVPIVSSIEEALTLGGDKLAVRGVLNIGEHGDYPETPDTKQRMYPRRRFFDEVAAVFRKCQQVVPLFNDKHLAYNWADAQHMYDTARAMHIPLMAGSSVPVGWRVPPLRLPRECRIEEALAVGYGGLESYGFHALEGLQCMVERRRGGERGVASVRAVAGDAIWEAERQGLWSRSLLEAALARQPKLKPGKHEDSLKPSATFFLIEYRDGLRATMAMATGPATEFTFAAKLPGESQPVSTWFQLENGAPYGHFGYLLRAVEHMIHTGQPAYPVERTLLTTGILDAALHSLAEGQKRRDTPHLEIRYEPVEWPGAPGEAPAVGVRPSG
jgi:hypothetical protein